MYGLEEIILQYLSHSNIEYSDASIYAGGVNLVLSANHFSHTVFEGFKRFDWHIGRTFQVPEPDCSVVGTRCQHWFVYVVAESYNKIIILKPTGVYSGIMACEFTNYLPGCYVPYKRVFVPSHGRKSIVISRYCDVQYFLIMRTTVLFYLISFVWVP